MPTRSVPDYDEDDYLPPGYVPPKPSGRGRKSLVAVIIVGLIFGAFALSFLMRTRVRARDAEIERVRALQEAMIGARQVGAARPMGPADSFSGAPTSNQMRIIGTWRREPAPESDSLQPHRFDFRPGLDAAAHQITAAVHQRNAEGSTMVREGRVEVMRDEQNELELRVIWPDGESESRFQVRMDGVLVLDDGRGGLAFNRLRSQLPAPPPVVVEDASPR